MCIKELFLKRIDEKMVLLKKKERTFRYFNS